jgi:hypothetical protein
MSSRLRPDTLSFIQGRFHRAVDVQGAARVDFQPTPGPQGDLLTAPRGISPFLDETPLILGE